MTAKPEAELLDSGWEAASAEPDVHSGPGEIDGLSWLPARVPGTAAGALRDAGREDLEGLDGQDWWFRTSFEAAPAAEAEQVRLAFGGVATVSEIFLNGERILVSDSMFATHCVEVGALLRGSNELAIRCRALEPLLAERRKPRARWRTKLVTNGNLRWFRTMLMGRAPGFAPGPPAVGPWRAVTLERRTGLSVEEIEVRAALEGNDGVLAITIALKDLNGAAGPAVEVELDGPSGTHRASLPLQHDGDLLRARGELRVPGAVPWWPHTHGEPALHDLRLSVAGADGGAEIAARRVGFRSITGGPGPASDVETDGLHLHVNGVPIFCRGAVWTPPDPVGLAPGRAEIARTLELARDAGMNMVRVPGTSAYEDAAFHELCDELGILVWQDMMFANLDYPFADEGFRETAESEARAVISRLAPHPSTAVLCGGSEVFQQVAMLGLDPALGRDTFYTETLPGLLADAQCDAVHVPSAPCGDGLPFHPGRGIDNYYGVGAYLRPLADARLAGVRFAAECLAFANLPDALGPNGDLSAGVPRDIGADWDFADVRDHYLGVLYDLDAAELMESDPERYLALSQAVPGEVMAEVLGEWRRAASPCRGALVLWLRDLSPGAGWGLLEADGKPKAAYHHLRRALAPRAVWLTDEGLAGYAVHVANDSGEPLRARLRLTLYRDGETRVDEAMEALEVSPGETLARNAEEMLGRFVDIGWAYRFGPPTQDLVVASLESVGGDTDHMLSQAFRFPLGRPSAAGTADELGLTAVLRKAGGDLALEVSTKRFAHGVRVQIPGFRAADDCFGIEPGGLRTVALTPSDERCRFTGGSVRALNLQGSVQVPAEGRQR